MISTKSTSKIEDTPWSLREVFERINGQTDKSVSCWLWRGMMNGGAHRPMLSIKRDGVYFRSYVRPIIYVAHYGPLPSGSHTTMTCGVDRCINPEHMKSESMKEMHARIKRRGRRPVSSRFKPTIPDEMVLRIVEMFHAGKSQKEISQQTGISGGTINDIVRGKIRRSVTRIGPIPAGFFHKRRQRKGDENGRSKLTWQEVLIAVGLLQRGYTDTTVAENFSVEQAQISCIKLGKGWKWLTGPLTPVRNHRSNMSETVARAILKTPSIETTEHERKILLAYASGQTDITISAAFDCSRHTLSLQCRRVRDLYFHVDRASVVKKIGLRGEQNPRSSLTQHQILEVLELFRQGWRQTEIAKKVGSTKNIVNSIIRGKTFSYLTGIHADDLRGTRYFSSRLTPSQVLEAVELRHQGQTLLAIATQLSVSFGCIGHIVRGETWSEITGIQPPVKPKTTDPHPDEALVLKHWNQPNVKP